MSWYQVHFETEAGKPRYDPFVPSKRECHSINVVGNQLVLFGGNDKEMRMDEVHMLNVDTMRWSILPKSEGGLDASIPVKRSAHSSALVDGRFMFVFGGWDGNTELGDLSCYDLELRTWSKPACTGEAPVPRHFHNTVFMGRRMYIFGGYDGTNWRSDISALDVDTMTWELVKPSGDEAPGARASGSCVIIGGNKILIFGGYNGEDFLQDLWILHTIDPATGQLSYRWEQLREPTVPVTTRGGIRIPTQPKPFWPLARSGHTADVFGPLVIILGGRHKNGRFNDIVVFNLDTFTWHEFVAGGEPFKARKTHAIGRIGSRLFLFGGHDGSNWMGDLHMLDLTGLAAHFSPKLSVYVPPTTLLHDLGSMVKDIDLSVPKCSSLSTSALAISTLRGGEGAAAGGIAAAAFEDQEEQARRARSLLRRVYKKKDPKNSSVKRADFPVNVNCCSLPYAVQNVSDPTDEFGIYDEEEEEEEEIDADEFENSEGEDENLENADEKMGGFLSLNSLVEDASGRRMADDPTDSVNHSSSSSSSSSTMAVGSIDMSERQSTTRPTRGASSFPRLGIAYNQTSSPSTSSSSSTPFPISSYETIFRERFGEKLGLNFLAPVSPPQQNVHSSTSSSSGGDLLDAVMSDRSSRQQQATNANSSSSLSSSSFAVSAESLVGVASVTSDMYTASSPGGGGGGGGRGAAAMPVPYPFLHHQPPGPQLFAQQPMIQSQMQDSYDASPVPDSDPSHALFALGLGTAATGFADVVFVVEDRPVSLHRCILVSRCEYFRAMFSSAFADANTRVIRLEDVEFHVFESAVRYIYTDQLPTAEVLDALCLPLLALAQRLGLKRLSGQCQRHLEGNVTVENAASMLETADMYGARPLRRACVKFITEHHTEVTCFMGSIIIDSLLSAVSTTSASSSSKKKSLLPSPGRSPGTTTGSSAGATSSSSSSSSSLMQMIGGSSLISVSSPSSGSRNASSGIMRQSLMTSSSSNAPQLLLSRSSTASVHGDQQQLLLSQNALQRLAETSSLSSSNADLLLNSSDDKLQRHLQYRSLLRAARSRDRALATGATTTMTGLTARSGRSLSRDAGFSVADDEATIAARALGAFPLSTGLSVNLDTHYPTAQRHSHSDPMSPSLFSSGLASPEMPIGAAGRRSAVVIDSGGASVSADLALMRIQSSPFSPSAHISSSRPPGLVTTSVWGEPSTSTTSATVGELAASTLGVAGAGGGGGELSFASKLAMVATAAQPMTRDSTSSNPETFASLQTEGEEDKQSNLAQSPSTSSAASSLRMQQQKQTKSPASGSKRRRERETSTTGASDGTGRGALELASDDEEVNISVSAGPDFSGTGGGGGGRGTVSVSTSTSSGGVGGGGGGDAVGDFSFEDKDADAGIGGKKRRQNNLY